MMVSAICVECTVVPAVAEMVTVVVTDVGLVNTIGGTALGVAQLASSRSESSAGSIRTIRPRRRLIPAPVSIRPQRRKPGLAQPTRRRSGKGFAACSKLTEFSEVWMVRVAATSVPGIVTRAGEKVHVVTAGSPEQESATTPA